MFCLAASLCLCARRPHRVAAVFVDDDAVGEGLVVGLNVQGPLPRVERVLLDEVDIIHTGDLDRADGDPG